MRGRSTLPVDYCCQAPGSFPVFLGKQVGLLTDVDDRVSAWPQRGFRQLLSRPAVHG